MRLILLVRLALRQIAARPAAALVTVGGLAVGVAGMRAMSLGADGALATMHATFVAAAGPAQWVAVPAGDARAALPDGALARLEAAPGVATVLPLVQAASVRLEEVHLWMGIVLPEGDAGLVVLGVDPTRERDAHRWTVVAGEGTVRAASPRASEPAGNPTADGAGAADPVDVLVGDAWARTRGLHPGDPLRIFAGGRIVSWRIAGTVSRSGLGGRGYGRVVLAPIDAVRTAFSLAPDRVDEVAIVETAAAEEAERAVATEGADEPPAALAAAAGPGVSVLRPGDRGGDVVQRLANLRAGTDLLSGVTLLLAALLVAGQFAARAAERARLLGLLRAVGATRFQAAATLIVEGMLLAVPGAALGLVVGAPLAAGVAWALGQGVQADLHVEGTDPAGAVRAFVVGLAVAFAAVALPAVRAARGAPLDAVRARSRVAEVPPTGGASLLALILAGVSLGLDPAGHADRAWTLARVLVGLAGAATLLPALVPAIVMRVRAAIALRLGAVAALGVASLRWRPVRSGLAAGAVLVCVALVGGVGALGGGMRAEMASWSARALGWDYYVSRPDGFGDEELAAVRGLPGVADAAGVSIRPIRAKVHGKPAELSLVALDPTSYARAELLTFVPGTAGDPQAIVASLADERGVLVTAVVAGQLGVAVGDILELPGRDGPVPVTVRGVVVDYTQNGFALLGAQGLLRRTQGATRVDVVAVRGDPAARPALEALPGVIVEARAELRGRVLRLVDQSMGALDVLLWLAGVVGVSAVAAALAQGAVERRADVAILRAVGLERRQVTLLLMAEGVTTALLGVFGGLPLGVALGKVFADATATLGIPIPYVPAWGALLGASIAAILTSAAAAWLPARRAAAIPPMDALRE